MDLNKAKKVMSIRHFRYEKQLILCLLFFLYSYNFSMLQSYYSTLAIAFFKSEKLIFNSGVSLLFYALGLLLCAVFLSFIKVKPSHLRLSMGVIALLNPPFLMLYFTTGNAVLFLISIFFLMVISGIQGVYIYKLMYESIAPASHTGKVYALGVSGSIILQYIFQMRVKTTNIILFSLLIVAFLTAFLFFSGITTRCEKKEQFLSDVNTDTEPKKEYKSFKFIFISILIVLILLEFTGNFLSYPLLALMSEGKPIAYSTPRLFIILAYIIMGIIADIEEMKYIPAVTFVGVLIGILNPVLLNDPSYIYLNACIYYVVAGTINSFLVLMMWKLAKGKKNAPLIASIGRIIDGIFSFIFISSIWSELSLSLIISLELTAIIIIMILFAFSGYFNFTSSEEPVIEHITPEEFSRYFELSDKEKEVFTAAISHNGTMSELAKRLYISRSILYRNINNICAKTGQDNFQSVIHLYYQMPVKKKIATYDLSSSSDSSLSADSIKNRVYKEDVRNNSKEKAMHNAKENVNNYSKEKPMHNTKENVNNYSKENVMHNAKENFNNYSKENVMNNVGDNMDNISGKSDTSSKQTDDIDTSNDFENKILRFSEAYALTAKETDILRLFIENPGKTQKELAEMQGTSTLRTVQRHLASIRTKTKIKSLVELSILFEKS